VLNRERLVLRAQLVAIVTELDAPEQTFDRVMEALRKIGVHLDPVEVDPLVIEAIESSNIVPRLVDMLRNRVRNVDRRGELLRVLVNASSVGNAARLSVSRLDIAPRHCASRPRPPARPIVSSG
jgi:hypothetical protein